VHWGKPPLVRPLGRENGKTAALQLTHVAVTNLGQQAQPLSAAARPGCAGAASAPMSAAASRFPRVCRPDGGMATTAGGWRLGQGVWAGSDDAMRVV
jgi:hypothetical protein